MQEKGAWRGSLSTWIASLISIGQEQVKKDQWEFLSDKKKFHAYNYFAINTVKFRQDDQEKW